MPFDVLDDQPTHQFYAPSKWNPADPWKEINPEIFRSSVITDTSECEPPKVGQHWVSPYDKIEILAVSDPIAGTGDLERITDRLVLFKIIEVYSYADSSLTPEDECVELLFGDLVHDDAYKLVTTSEVRGGHDFTKPIPLDPPKEKKSWHDSFLKELEESRNAMAKRMMGTIEMSSYDNSTIYAFLHYLSTTGQITDPEQAADLQRVLKLVETGWVPK